jgi:hypothetical protein
MIQETARCPAGRQSGQDRDFADKVRHADRNSFGVTEERLGLPPFDEPQTGQVLGDRCHFAIDYAGSQPG